MKRPIFPVLLTALLCSQLRAEDWMAKLQSSDITVRRQAVDRIQILDDTRIPDICLPLLTDEGRSIRRQAARAIGSRFAQVPAEKIPAFLKALRQCAKEGPEDVTFVANRAVGLLARKFDGPAFSVSPDRRWVLFEERRLPVIADLQLQHLQMLGLQHPDPQMIWKDTEVRGGAIVDLHHTSTLLKLMATNESMQDLFAPRWHPKGEALALQPTIQRRFYQPIAIWRARDGAVRTWSVNSFKDLYGKRFPHWSTTTDFVEWRGSKAVIHIYDCDDGAGDGMPFDPKGILVSVDIETWKTKLE